MQWDFAMEGPPGGFRDPRKQGWNAMAMRGGGRRRWAGHGGGGAGPFDFHRGPRARRGDIRVAILELLAEEPRNGYQLMQEIERRSEGAWRPSSGSVYPKLQQLEDEGLVRVEQTESGRLFHVTDAGRAEAEKHDREASPWETAAGSVDTDARDLMGLIRGIAMALTQVVREGNQQQVSAARKVMVDARRQLHLILAEDEPQGDDEERA